MQLSDSREIAAPPEVVWAAILNTEVLKACIPGCESLEGTPEGGYTAVVAQKIGPVSARFTGSVTLSDIRPPEGLTISGEGKAGPAGFARGSAHVTFAPSAAGTLLSYQVDAAIGGKIAQLGSRIIDGFVKKVADEFFRRFQESVEAPPSDGSLDGNETDSVQEEKKGWFGRLIGG
jgi:carbon monoxide dehydrogenase subunit G